MAMQYEEIRTKPVRAHALSLSERRRLSISGVEDVEAFDEERVVLSTAGGDLTILGSGLKIEKLSLDGGELLVEGQIDGLHYAQQTANRRGLLGKLFG